MLNLEPSNDDEAPVDESANQETSPETYSIRVRVRRVTIEDAYVAVPVTDAIIKPHPDGTGRIDGDLLEAEARRIGNDPRTEWKFESTETEMHPWQSPMPADRHAFDAIVDLKFEEET
jgi:hypothetical protein